MHNECKNGDWVYFLPIVGQRNLFMLPELAAVSAAHHPGAGLVFTKYFLHGISYFTNRTSKKRNEFLKKADSIFPQYVFSLHHMINNAR